MRTTVEMGTRASRASEIQRNTDGARRGVWVVVFWGWFALVASVTSHSPGIALPRDLGSRWNWGAGRHKCTGTPSPLLAFLLRHRPICARVPDHTRALAHQPLSAAPRASVAAILVLCPEPPGHPRPFQALGVPQCPHPAGSPSALGPAPLRPEAPRGSHRTRPALSSLPLWPCPASLTSLKASPGVAPSIIHLQNNPVSGSAEGNPT